MGLTGCGHDNFARCDQDFLIGKGNLFSGFHGGAGGLQADDAGSVYAKGALRSLHSK